MADAGRSVGTVKWFSDQKGFGFVSSDDGGDDLFVHQTEIQTEGFRTLREGQRVEFKVDFSGDGRSKAVDVFIIERSYSSGGKRGGRNRGGGGGYGRGSAAGGRGDDGVECYNCGKIGHFARDCYRDGGGGGYQGYGRRGGVGRARGGGSGSGRECYNCGEEGHFAKDCPIIIVERMGIL